MVFDYELLTVLFMRKGKPSSDLAELVQLISQESTHTNTYIKDTWFMPGLEDHPSKF